MVVLFVVQILVLVVAIRYMFICFWKSMRQMEDDLVAVLGLRLSLTSAILLSYLRAYGPGKPTMYMIICTGVYNPDLEKIDRLHHG